MLAVGPHSADNGLRRCRDERGVRLREFTSPMTDTRATRVNELEYESKTVVLKIVHGCPPTTEENAIVFTDPCTYHHWLAFSSHMMKGMNTRFTEWGVVKEQNVANNLK
ncbi:hypothetical protein EVAR_79779_1 [Eumeta japonica]|uniref:Uncharacterized protein n=1 Tax=Eumeta variegata TaxID=151549 RepID=A0A4C1TAF4_EUMVA|nr:hypothetical protein EVAR_79779_1 [Eumeta japonica]